MKIDIERLIDAVAAENEAYNEYCYSSKTLYRGPFEEITTRKNHVNYAREVHDREQNAVDTLAEVFQMDTETRNRLYIATRAVNRWRNATQWARLIPDTMQDPRSAGLSSENPKHLIALVNIAEYGRHRRTAADHPPRLCRIY